LSEKALRHKYVCACERERACVSARVSFVCVRARIARARLCVHACLCLHMCVCVSNNFQYWSYCLTFRNWRM